MAAISPDMSTLELLKLANDNFLGQLELSELDRGLLLELLREKGREELEFGQELEHEKVRLVKRVTGAVSIFFEKDEPAKTSKTKKKAD